MKTFARFLIVPLAFLFTSPALAEGLPDFLSPVIEDPLAIGVGGGDDAPARPAAKKHKRLSIDFSVGVRPDMANLGQTIAQDGTVDTADTTVASLAYVTDKAIMSDRDNFAIAHNSKRTNSEFMFLAEDPTLGGALLGVEVGGRITYELDDLIGAPIFVRAGFLQTVKMSGGVQSRTLGTAAVDILPVAQALSIGGFNPDDFVGGTMKTTFDASWYEIPISIGFKVPLAGTSMVYGSVGVSIFKGGFSLRLEVDENYANVLATHIDTSDGLSVTNYSPGAVDDTIHFNISTMGINYGLGAQVEIGMGFNWFLELNGSGAAKTVLSSDLKPETRRLLTATSSEALAKEDPEWFDRLAFPVVTAGATMRTGVRYYIY